MVKKLVHNLPWIRSNTRTLGIPRRFNHFDVPSNCFAAIERSIQICNTLIGSNDLPRATIQRSGAVQDQVAVLQASMVR